MKQRLRHLLYVILLVALDQVTKYYAKTTLKEEGPLILIPKVFNFQYHENDGAVWGILSGKMDFLVIFTIILMCFILFMYFKIPQEKKYNPILLIWVFIFSGAIGNFIDRIALGYVVDFIYFELINFPLFNVADMYLTVSCFLLFFLAIFYYKDEDFKFLDNMFKTKKSKKEDRKEV